MLYHSLQVLQRASLYVTGGTVRAREVARSKGDYKNRNVEGELLDLLVNPRDEMVSRVAELNTFEGRSRVQQQHTIIRCLWWCLGVL